MQALPEFTDFEAAILEVVQAAVIVSDLNGTLLYANPFSERMYGRPVGAMVGSSAIELAGVEVSPDNGLEILRALLDGRAWEGDYEVQRPDGSVIVAHAVDSGLFDDEGNLTAVVSVVTDVSEERRSLDQLSRLFSERDQVATSLQAALLPPSLPEVPGFKLAARYRAAGEGIDVGGDFYDVFSIGEDAWAAVIGDVSGRGHDAAAVTGLVRYALRASAHQARRPAAMLEVANAVLCESQGPLAERFCTVTCAVVRPGVPTTFDVASAGHPPPLVLRSDGSIEELDCQGVALGLVTTPDLRSIQTTVQPGEAVVFYTDGLSEARDHEGRLFGEVGLHDALSACRGLEAEGIARSLLRAVEAFSAGRITDDLALLVLTAD